MELRDLTGTERAAPPELFLDIAQRIAQVSGLDVDKVVAGYPLHYEGIIFWLQHHGQFDSDGMVLMVEIGTLGAEDSAPTLRRLLEYNYATPAGLHGYCAVMPHSDVVAYCMRIDLARTADAAGTVFDVVERMASCRPAIEAMLRKEGFAETRPPHRRQPEHTREGDP